MSTNPLFLGVADKRSRRAIRQAFESNATEYTGVTSATAGVVEAEKAVVVDAGKSIGDFANLDCTNLDAGKSGTAGSVDVFASTGSKGKLTVTCADQDGNTTVTLQPMAMGQATTVKIPDPGAATSYLMQMAAENDQKLVASTPTEIDNVADVSGRVQELTSSGAVTAGKQSVELNHATVVVAATIADFANHQGLFVVKDTSASGTAEHTLTLTAGTFNGTNNVATLNAPDEALVVYVDSAGNGTILENVGSVALSGP